MKRLLVILPVFVMGFMACNNVKQELAIEQNADSIVQAHLDSIEQVRKDSLEQLRQDSIEKRTIINEKIAFLKDFIDKFDYFYRDSYDNLYSDSNIKLYNFIRRNLSNFAYEQLDAMKDVSGEEGDYDEDYFLDGHICASGHQARVDDRKVTHVNGNWFKVSSRLYDATVPEYQQHYNASYQVMVEDVDGRYMITKLKINPNN